MIGRIFLITGAIVETVLLTMGDTLAQDAPTEGGGAPTPVHKSKKKKAAQPTKRKGSRIVDDSTHAVYGPKTVLWTTEKSLFYNQRVYVPIDTSYENFHRWTYIQKLNNYYKDLGNVGTALCPIFPTLSSTIGANSGFTTYQLYYQTEEPKYFDTKSPYVHIYVIWGGQGRAMTRIEYSRNINKRWNFGFDYRPILADKQIQYQKSDRQTISNYYDFYTTYKSKNDKYLLLFNYRRIRHRVVENGGVNLTSGGAFDNIFDPNAPINLTLAVTEDTRSGFHLFQQYQLARPFQVYTISDIATQTNKFSDQTSGELVSPTSFFGFSEGDSINAADKSVLSTIQNEAGIKGNAGPLFYDFYFKLRSYQYENFFLSNNQTVLTYKKTGLEEYVGGRIALRFDSVTELSGNAEYLLDGHYKLEAEWKSPWIDASAKSTLSRPGFMQNVYQGSHNFWTNSFTSVASQQLNGFIKAKIGPLFISPGATFTTLSNYVFFKQSDNLPQYQSVLPYQSGGVQIAFSPEVRMTLRLSKHITFKPQAIYTLLLKNDDGALQIPQLFVNSQLSYEGPFFKGNLHVQFGVDAHWQSTYKALGYETSIQQFYVQNSSTSPSFLLADVFLNAKIKRGRIFFKYQNLVQAFTKEGYIPTPTYPGQRNLLDFGFIMLFFD